MDANNTPDNFSKEISMYLVTKQFLSGALSGLTITEKTSVLFTVGRTYKPCAGSSTYKVLAVEAI